MIRSGEDPKIQLLANWLLASGLAYRGAAALGAELEHAPVVLYGESLWAGEPDQRR